MSKVAVVIGGVFGAVALAWGGTAFYSSLTFDKQLTESLSKSTDQLKLTQVHADHGLLSSSGIIGWRLALDCEDRGAIVSGQVNYSVDHKPTMSGATSVQSSISVDGELGKQLKATGNTNHLVSIDGVRGYDGQWNTEIKTPKISYDSDTVALRVSASKGTWKGDESSGVLNWTMGQVNGSMNENAERFSMKNLSINYTLEDVVLGLGAGNYGISEIKSEGAKGSTVINGLTIAQSTQMNGDVVDSVVQPSIKSLVLPQAPELRNVGMKMSMTGFDGNAYEDLSTMQSNSACADLFNNKDQLMIVERAIAEVLDRGWKIAIDNVKAEVDDGSFDANLKFAFAGVTGSNSDASLASRIKIDGNVTALGAIIPPGFDEMLLGTGYLVGAPGGNGVTGSIKLENGKLQINGETDDDLGAQLQFFLNIGDSQMDQWRAGLDNGESMLAGVMGKNRF